MEDMKVKKLVVGDIETNCYIVFEQNNKGIIIDPGDDSDTIIDFVENKNIEVQYILNTHGHYDHIGANDSLADYFNAPIYIHKQDNYMLEKVEENFSMYINKDIQSRKADKLLYDGNIIELGEHKWHVLHTPGHTKGSIVIYNKEQRIMFTGDTLFAEGWGRTDLPGGNKEQIKISLKKLLTFDGSYRCYPGHGESFLLSKRYQVIKNLLKNF